MVTTYGAEDSDEPILAYVSRDEFDLDDWELKGELLDPDDGSLVQALSSDGPTDENGEVYFEEFSDEDLLDQAFDYDVLIYVTDGERRFIIYEDRWTIEEE